MDQLKVKTEIVEDVLPAYNYNDLGVDQELIGDSNFDQYGIVPKDKSKQTEHSKKSSTVQGIEKEILVDYSIGDPIVKPSVAPKEIGTNQLFDSPSKKGYRTKPPVPENIANAITNDFTLSVSHNSENEQILPVESPLPAKIRRKRNKSPDGRFRCDLCCKNYVKKSNLKQHCARFHVQSVTGMQCEVCQKRFYCEQVLKDHMNIHLGLKPYCCTLCEKSFSFQSNLNTHINTIHHKDKPYECDICNKTFAFKSILGKHMRIHTGAVPYKCPHCNKKFSHSSHRNRHIRRIHKEMLPNGENVKVVKKHTCEVCGKNFAESSRLKVHIQCVHDMVKPHSCLICKRCFGTASGRNSHVKKVHALDT